MTSRSFPPRGKEGTATRKVIKTTHICGIGTEDNFTGRGALANLRAFKGTAGKVKGGRRGGRRGAAGGRRKVGRGAGVGLPCGMNVDEDDWQRAACESQRY